MAIGSYKRPHAIKPKFPVGIDWRHPAARHLTKAFYFNSGKAVDIAKTDSVSSSSATIKYDKHRANFTGTPGEKILLDAPFDFPNNEGTVICVANRASTAAPNSGLVSDMDVANYNINGFHLDYRVSACILLVNDREANGTHNLTHDIPHNFLVQFSAGNPVRLFIDEEELTYSLQENAPITFTQSSVNARIGTYYNEAAGRQFRGHIEVVLAFDKELPDTLALSLSKNPYQLLQPQTQYIPVTVDAGTIINASTDGLTLTENVAGISAATNVNAGFDSLTLAEQAASISAATNVNANVTNLTLTEYPVTLGLGTNVSANVDSLVLSTYSTTVSTTLVTASITVASQMLTFKTETALPIELSVDNSGGVTGLTVTASIRDGADSTNYLDFNDNTFKTSGWTTKSKTLSEITTGFYGTTQDITAITNLPDSKNLIVEYDISGSVIGIASGVITFNDSLTTSNFIALAE